MVGFLLWGMTPYPIIIYKNISTFFKKEVL